MKVWVSRDNGWGYCAVETRDHRPSRVGPCFIGDEIMMAVEPVNFKHLFGFTPRKGSCKQYELTLKEIT